MVYQFCEHKNYAIQMNCEISHPCPECGAIMTFGKWSIRTPDRVNFEREHEIEYFDKYNTAV